MLEKLKGSVSIEKLWLKLLLTVLVVVTPVFAVTWLYSNSSDCVSSWNCLGFELIAVSGGILLFSLPIVTVLFIWEAIKKVSKDTGKENSEKK